MERGGETEDINNRLKSYAEEIQDLHLYDVAINNEHGKFEETVKKLKDTFDKKKNA